MPRSAAILLPLLILVLTRPASADPFAGRPDHPRLEAHAGAIVLSQSDMNATYGALFTGGLALSLRTSERSRLGLGLGYGRREGDPYAPDDDGFSGGQARVTCVPLSLSLRTTLVRGRSVDLIGGVDLQYAWLQERVPTGLVAPGLETFDGEAAGIVVSLGPSWTHGRHVLSLDVALGGVSGEVQLGTRRHEVDLRGLHLRVGYAVALGAPEVK